MSALKNTVQLIGHVGRDPELRTTGADRKMAKFSLATGDTYKNSKGETITDTHWHSLIAWGKLAEIVGKVVKQGSEVAVEGKLVTRSYVDKEGVKRTITEIQVNELLVLTKQKAASSAESS